VAATDRVARAAVVRAASDPSRAVRLAAAFGLRSIEPDSLDVEPRAKVERALAEWIAAGDVLSDSPEVQYNRGVFWTARGDATRAEAAYRAAIALWPHDFLPRQNLAMLLSQNARPREAEREFQAILERSPNWPPAAFALGLLYAEQLRWSEAAEQLEGCLAANPRYPRAAYNLGIVLLALGRDEDGVRRLEEATSDPSSRLDALRRLVQRANDGGDEAALQRWVSELLLTDPLTRDDPRVRAALEGAESPE
jgi:tetratricopeptide (TPR) repeat protein